MSVSMLSVSAGAASAVARAASSSANRSNSNSANAFSSKIQNNDFVTGSLRSSDLKPKMGLRVSTAINSRVAALTVTSVFNAPGSPGTDSAIKSSDRLDELGSSRRRRLKSVVPSPAAQKSGAKIAQSPSRGVAFGDLLEGPSRRSSRASSSASFSSTSSLYLKDANDPLLGMLDELGSRVGRGRDNSNARRRGGGGMMGEGVEGVGGGVLGAAVGAVMGAFGDLFEAPGRRVRRSQSHRETRAAAKANSVCSSASASVGYDMLYQLDAADDLVLGLLASPGARRGRVNKNAGAGAAGAAAAAAAAAGAGAAAAATAGFSGSEDTLLGILSGPRKRTSHSHKKNNSGGN